MSRVIAIGSGVPAPVAIGREHPDGYRGPMVRGVSQEELNSAAFAAKEAAQWIARQARAPPASTDTPALVASFGATSADARDGPASARDPPSTGRNLVVEEGRYTWAWQGPPEAANGALSDPAQEERTRERLIQTGLLRDLPLAEGGDGSPVEQKLVTDFSERLAIKLERQRETAEGRTLGWRDGYASGMRRCLVSLLSARGWSLSPDVAAQIQTASPTDLAGWFQRALGAEDPNTIFEEKADLKSA